MDNAVSKGIVAKTSEHANQKEDKHMNRIINVMGIDINHISFQTLKSTTSEYLNNDRLNSYVFLSTQLIEETAEDIELAQSLKEADLLLPGEEQVYGVQPKPLVKKNMVMGYRSLLELADKMEKPYTVYFMGADQNAIDRMTTFTMRNFTKLRIVGVYDQQEQWTDEQLVNAINSANPDMIINTIPTPMEGKWVASYGQQINAKLYIGLGSIFDTMVSELKDPPLLFRKLHLLTLYHKIRGYRKHKSLRLRIFRRKVEQYNTKKGENENGSTK